MGPIAETDAGAVGGIIDILSAVRKDIRIAVIEPGKPRRHIRNSVVEIDLHSISPFPLEFMPY
jgi:hypothetical protein